MSARRNLGRSTNIENKEDWLDALDEAQCDYECQVCGKGSDPDDHKKHTHNWCERCDEMTFHERRDW